MFKTLAGLSAAIAFFPIAAQADSVGKWAQTMHPPRVEPIAIAAPELTVVPVASAAVDEPRQMSRSRHARAHAPRILREAAATVPVETTPAPTPADMKATTRDTPPASGPHEDPAPTLRDLVNRHARASGVPEKLASAVVSIESRFNPKARGGHALGLMQIQYATARAAGFSGSASGLFEPETNLQYGMKVLADAYKSSNGNVCLALAKYQSGHLTTHVSAANRAYCARARALMAKA